MNPVRNIVRSGHLLSAARPALRSPALPVLAVAARRGYHEKDMFNLFRRMVFFLRKFRIVFPALGLEVVKDFVSSEVGSLDRKSVDVGSGLVGAPACGDVIRLDIQVDEKTGKIVKSAFKTFGCGSAIASSSYLTTLLAGKTLEEAGQIQNTQIANELCLPPVKLHCSLLAEDAIKAAIKNYQSKRPAAAATNLADTSKAFKESVASAQA
ncbi:iron-sulfur cofactor synthesis protein [Talaromyces pinophilus]|uniref:Iron-sulfur cofactor synthesis protein n=1 Tax=Talaromyces pinophilus TaxID=128442 RepID=A0A0B8N7A1_TALPI|nr:Iron sulfur cluster assembly protein 1 [Talaromyces pinophilus]GAM43423.1 iron-sulfur cofactor synthesis protein [Talaromyces pinophilus]